MAETNFNWTKHANCQGMEDALFPDAADEKEVVARVCKSGCKVMEVCFWTAIQEEMAVGASHGVRGGATARVRRELIRTSFTGKNAAVGAELSRVLADTAERLGVQSG